MIQNNQRHGIFIRSWLRETVLLNENTVTDNKDDIQVNQETPTGNSYSKQSVNASQKDTEMTSTNSPSRQNAYPPSKKLCVNAAKYTDVSKQSSVLERVTTERSANSMAARIRQNQNTDAESGSGSRLDRLLAMQAQKPSMGGSSRAHELSKKMMEERLKRSANQN